MYKKYSKSAESSETATELYLLMSKKYGKSAESIEMAPELYTYMYNEIW